MQTIESNQGVEIEELLRRLFVDENLSIEEIGKRLQLSYPHVIRWLRLAGVRSRRITL